MATETLLPNQVFSNTFDRVPRGTPVLECIGNGVSTPDDTKYLDATLTDRSVDLGFPVPGANKATSQIEVRMRASAQFIPLQEALVAIVLYIDGSPFSSFNFVIKDNPGIIFNFSNLVAVPDIEISSIRLTATTTNVGPFVPTVDIYELDQIATYEFIQKTTLCVKGGFKTKLDVVGSIPGCN